MKGGKGACGYLRICIPGRGDGKCKGPGAGMWLECQDQQACQYGLSRVRAGRAGRHEVGKVMRVISCRAARVIVRTLG